MGAPVCVLTLSLGGRLFLAEEEESAVLVHEASVACHVRSFLSLENRRPRLSSEGGKGQREGGVGRQSGLHGIM